MMTINNNKMMVIKPNMANRFFLKRRQANSEFDRILVGVVRVAEAVRGFTNVAIAIYENLIRGSSNP